MKLGKFPHVVDILGVMEEDKAACVAYPSRRPCDGWGRGTGDRGGVATGNY